MSTAILNLQATYAFMERNVNLVKRYWAWELVWMTYSIANSLSVSFIGLGMEALSGEQANVNGRYLVLYLVIGTLVWRYLTTVFYWITEVISIERWEGTIEYTLMAPIRRVVHMAGQTIFAVVYGLFFTGVILAVTVMIFELDLTQANLVGGLAMLIAGSFSFIGISIMALSGARRPDDAHRDRNLVVSFRGVLPDRGAAHRTAKTRCDQPGHLRTDWSTRGTVRRPIAYPLMAVYLAGTPDGSGTDPRRLMGFQPCRTLCEANRQTGKKRIDLESAIHTGTPTGKVASLFESIFAALMLCIHAARERRHQNVWQNR